MIARILTALLVAAALLHDPAASAQADYPNRPVTLIVPYPAGATDTFARMLADRLAQAWGQGVVVENRPGASGVIGMVAGKDAAPNGYTLVLTMSGPLAGNPNLMPKLPYDPLKDYAFISGLMVIPLMFVAHPSTPYSNVKELVAAAKARPGSITYASAGNGTTNHMAGELFKSRAGIEMLHVPYKGTTGGVADLLGGHLPLMVLSVQESIPHLKTGKLKAIAVTGSSRAPQLPDVPTIAESGYPGYEGVGWGGIGAPAATPRAIVQKIDADIRKIMADPAFATKVVQVGLAPEYRDAVAFREYIQAEIDKWGKVVREAKIKVD